MTKCLFSQGKTLYFVVHYLGWKVSNTCHNVQFSKSVGYNR
jgi:hypothetical protein